MKFAYATRMLSRMICLEIECTLPKQRMYTVQGHTKISQYITAYEGKFFKISFDMVIVHKI